MIRTRNDCQINHLIKVYTSSIDKQLFDWQRRCIFQDAFTSFSSGKNLILRAPTNSGKSLIAELLMLNRILSNFELKSNTNDIDSSTSSFFDSNLPAGKALYISPYVSIAREKLLDMQRSMRDFGIKVEGYFGACSSVVPFDLADVAICTIEKANNMINKLIEDDKLNQIGIIVVDEFHNISDDSRGYLVELLISKILYHNNSQKTDIQILCMSATLPNAKNLAHNWLNANVYFCDERASKLEEYVYCAGRFHAINRHESDRSNCQTTKKLSENLCNLPNDPENILGLILETVLDGFSVLVFCSSRSWCEKLSYNIASSLDKLMKTENDWNLTIKNLINFDNQLEFFTQYKIAVKCVDQILAKTLKYAVAFHHAGLTLEERDQLERGFERGSVKVLVATSTLCSGVNLPAKRVIIRSLWGYETSGMVSTKCETFRGVKMTSTSYRQMVGRAGRSTLKFGGKNH